MDKYIPINLINNKGFKWYKYKNEKYRIWVKGFLKFEDQYLFKEEFAKFLFNNSKKIFEYLENADGQFSFVISKPDYTLAVVDHMRSFPLMYYMNDKGNYSITDCINEELICRHKLNKEVIPEFRHALFVFENKTLLKDVYQIPSSSYLVINNCQLILKKYWTFRYADERIEDIQIAVKKISDGYDNLFLDIKRILGEKKILIPLSGGYDSRLILGGLLKSGVRKDKIITFTYGDSRYIDTRISKKVANKVGVKHYFIPYNTKEARKFYKNNINDFFLYSGNISSVPCLQEWYALHKLKQLKVIDQNMIIISGYGGVLPGHYIKKQFFGSQSYLRQEIKRELCDFIFQKHFVKSNDKRSFVGERVLNSSYFSSSDDSNLVEQYESWIFGEEQAKYIQNAVRDYEEIGCKWITPFFFKQQFIVWGEISNILRSDNKAFKQCIDSYYKNEIFKVEFSGSKVVTSKRHNKLFRYIHLFINLIFNREKVHYLFAIIPFKVYLKNEIKSLTVSPNDIIAEEYLSWMSRICGE